MFQSFRVSPLQYSFPLLLPVNPPGGTLTSWLLLHPCSFPWSPWIPWLKRVIEKAFASLCLCEKFIVSHKDAENGFKFQSFMFQGLSYAVFGTFASWLLWYPWFFPWNPWLKKAVEAKEVSGFAHYSFSEGESFKSIFHWSLHMKDKLIPRNLFSLLLKIS